VAQSEAVQRQALFAIKNRSSLHSRTWKTRWSTARSSGRTREVQARNVAALQRFRDLAALRYKEGATIYLEVANAEQSLFNAQLAYVATQSQLFRSYAKLVTKRPVAAGSQRRRPLASSRVAGVLGKE